MKLRDLLLVTSEDVFDLSEEDGKWVLDQEVFHMEFISNKLHVYTR